jgi:hypothetical protein
VAQKSFALAEAMIRAGRSVTLVAITELRRPDEIPAILDVRTTTRKKYWEEAERFFNSLKGDEVVLFRYPFASKPLLQLVQKFGSQIIFEHNTIEQAEMLLLQRAHFERQPFSLRPGYMRYALNTLIFKSTEESQLGSEILRHVKGGVCVSHEIMRYECSRLKQYRTAVIANGAHVAEVGSGVVPESDDELRLVMLVGSVAIWHGYERLLHSLIGAKPSRRVRLLLVGMDRPSDFSWPSEIQHTVEWLGRKSKSEVAAILKTCHIAVGTLALYKKSMKEASPLKVRECLLMGLPMILGYHDTDITPDNRFLPYVFQVPNDNSKIDFQALADWFDLLSHDEDYRKRISALANQTLSMEAKAKGYLVFFDSLFDG